MTTPPIRLTALRVSTKDNGTYALDPRGKLMAVVPVRDRMGEIVDAAAFLTSRPGRWWLRYRDTAILCARAFAIAEWDGRPLKLWETPLQWLLQGRRGSVILDWGADLRPMFEDVPEITCQSTALRDRLQANFVRFGPRLTMSSVDIRTLEGLTVAERS